MSTLSAEELDALVAHIAAHLGLSFPPSKQRTLEDAFRLAAKELGFADMRECVVWFLSTPPSKPLLEAMAGYLTIGETYFLRESRSFEALEQEIIPAIIRTRQGGEQRLRVWSAGCATGEEPYTIAIILHRMREALRGWELSILATDINPQALAKAKEGVYTEWSFRNTPAEFKEHYFKKIGEGRFALRSKIRAMVNFSYLNLVEDIYPALPTGTNAIDIIFCRNVLMYFTPERAREVVDHFHRSLLDQGWLIVSPCEAATPIFSEFTPIHFPEAILFRKQAVGTTAWADRGANELREWGSGHGGAAPPPPLIASDPAPELPPLYPSPPPLDLRLHAPPPVPVTPYDEAKTLYEQGKYQEAAILVEAHLALQQEDTRALALLSRIYANEGRLGEALRLSEQALANDKLNAGLYYLRAVILQEEGLIDEAINSLKRALYLDQEMALAHFTLGNLALRQGKTKVSKRYFDNTLALLANCHPDELLPESDGMSAGRVRAIIHSTPGTFQHQEA